jgi:hypothetical protein
MLAAFVALKAAQLSASAVQWHLNTNLMKSLLMLCGMQQQLGADVTAVVHEMN